jgi:exosortase
MDKGRSTATRTVLFWAVLFAALVWAYWPPIVEMVGKWLNDPQYSHAYFVPAFSLVLVWMRRKELAECRESAPLAGLGLVLLGLAVRVAGTAIYLDWLETISLLPVLAGAVLVVWGWEGLAKTWYAVAFLFFMVPLPYSVEMALSHPMQRLATRSSTFLLQMLGFPAFAEGNVIVLGESRIGIVEACNGLGMLILFFALAVGVALVIRRPLIDRAIIVLSAAPIAVLSNTLRITITSIIHDKMGHYYGEMLGHNQGWVMMPMALAMLWLELKVLDWVLIDDREETLSPLEMFSQHAHHAGAR